MSERNNEQYKALLRRYNSMVLAAEKNQLTINQLVSENAVLRADRDRLSAELSAARNNTQLLGDDYNWRSKSTNEQIMKLRALLKEHGIDAEEI